MNAVAKNLKKLRLNRGLSQEELAEKLHVTRQTVSSWENGKSQPDIDMLLSIAAVLDAEVTELLYGPKIENAFAAGRRRRLLRAALLLGLLSLLLAAETILTPIAREQAMRGYQMQLSYLLVFALRPVMMAAIGVAAVALLSVWWDLRIKKRGSRWALLLCAVLPAVLFAVFLALVWGGVRLPDWLLTQMIALRLRFSWVFLPQGACLFLALADRRDETCGAAQEE